MLGLGLKLPLRDVEAIHSLYQNPRDRLLHVIIAFLRQGDSPSWKTIVEALRSPKVNLKALAITVEKEHCLSQVCLCVYCVYV